MKGKPMRIGLIAAALATAGTAAVLTATPAQAASAQRTVCDGDVLIGSLGPDVIYGTCGDDDMFGLRGRDRLFGQFGDDLIVGGRGNDHLFGGFGEDTLRGGQGYDVCTGGLADTFVSCEEVNIVF